MSSERLTFEKDACFMSENLVNSIKYKTFDSF